MSAPAEVSHLVPPGATEDFDRKYRNVDLKSVRAEAISDPDECAYLVIQLDLLVASIEEQLTRFWDNSTADWRARAGRAMRYAKMQRNAMQHRVGILKRHGRESRIERLFMDRAREMLPSEVFEAVLAMAAADAQALRSDQRRQETVL